MRRYKKDAPLFVESVWDGNDDDCSNGISYRKMFLDEKNRVAVNAELSSSSEKFKLQYVLTMISNLANKFNCSHISIESKGYTFHRRNVFPDRLSVGWMLYIPHTLLPELIPEAVRVVPVMDGGKQKGTIVVSTEDVFDGRNKEHIGKANDIEIKLLDLGLLPLMTEL
ncbi:Imm52 family immunity protein [Serratia marcescens]|uniref:Imm52 family immunity protein n=1 Tax=Serratia marcescens TaxID=615 RepID=UPI003F7767E0